MKFLGLIAAGESSGELVVRIIGDTNVESNEFVRLYFHQFEGIVGHQGDPTQTEALVGILTDDGSAAPPPTRAYDDYRQTLTNVERYRIDVFSNDFVATQDEEGATMSLVSPPSHGGVEFVPLGTVRWRPWAIIGTHRTRISPDATGSATACATRRLNAVKQTSSSMFVPRSRYAPTAATGPASRWSCVERRRAGAASRRFRHHAGLRAMTGSDSLVNRHPGLSRVSKTIQIPKP